MCKAHSGAGEHKNSANPEWWRLFSGRSFVEFGISNEDFERDEKQSSSGEADEGRDNKPEPNFHRLRPIDTFADRVGWTDKCVCEADSDNRSNEGV